MTCKLGSRSAARSKFSVRLHGSNDRANNTKKSAKILFKHANFSDKQTGGKFTSVRNAQQSKERMRHVSNVSISLAKTSESIKQIIVITILLLLLKIELNYINSLGIEAFDVDQEQILEQFLPDQLSRLDLIASTDGSSLVDEPDGATIERLTKSCLTVHASSSLPEHLNISFHLYTRNNPLNPFIVRPQISRLELLQGSPFERGRPIKWITHGFHTNVDKSHWMMATKDKILANEDANVILTDWRRGASPALAFYPKAAANAHIVAKMIVRILRRIRQDISLAQVHLIGHSLGAHIMGFVGSTFTDEWRQRKAGVLSEQGVPGDDLVGRITACDPALPCFGPSSSAPDARLQRPSLSAAPTSPTVPALADEWWPASLWTRLRLDSAALVEVMHSNPGIMGYAEPLGDFDFYPNGMERQPGCNGSAAEQGPPRARRSRLASTLDRFMRPIRNFVQGYTCSHHRAVEYMVESMYYERVPIDRRLDKSFVCQMVGYRCADYASFRRGFCFRCQEPTDCRTFFMDFRAPSDGSGAESISLPASSSSRLLVAQKFRVLDESLNAQQKQQENQHQQQENRSTGVGWQATSLLNVSNLSRPKLSNYRAPKRNTYYFDTKPTKDYCLHHYHLLVKYRWFRVRESVQVDGFSLSATLGNISQLDAPTTFNRFTHHAYTLLLTKVNFLGQIESLVLYGDKIRPTLIEHVEVTYMSNLDPRIRSLGSARLCRAPINSNPAILGSGAHVNVATLFVRCSIPMV